VKLTSGTRIVAREVEIMRGLFRKPLTWVALTVVVAGAVVALALFEPWRLFTSSRVDEPLPVAQTEPTSTPTDTGTSATTTTTTTPTEPVVLAEGQFVNGEHDTSGTARVLRLPDGSRILRLENFATSDGPDVRVWLTDQTAGGEWGAYDDGRVVQLGEMKATEGNQNYVIPADVDLAGLRSAVIWCDRFDVAFGTAGVAL
jgi:electron transfer DM13